MLAPEQINLYIAERPEAQRKVLVRLRQLIHSVDGDIEENWRASGPQFDHDGAPMIGLSAHRSWVNVIFHQGAGIKDPKHLFEPCPEEKESRTFRVKDGEALNEAGFVDLVKKAVGRAGRSGKSEGRGLDLPADLEVVLQKDPTAWANWKGFTFTQRKEYVEWIDDGRNEETCKRRIAQAFEMIREGISKEEKAPLKGA
ncbi:MAG TPA: YdeI/OmpD-associated family protein [Flavobacteriales bacterium]